MAVLNYTGEELNAKIVYYGPGVSGKTTNLEYIHSHMPVSVKGQMVSMKTRTDRTLFFDFLPIDFGDIGGCRTRFLLYTVPGQVYYNATRKLVLKGVDAVVFVADSARDKLVENLESLRNLEDNLNELGMTLDDLPWVIQYNKRDLDDAMPVPELEQRLNLLGVPAFEASAVNGEGVFETFQGVAKLLYHDLKQKLERGEVAAPAQSDPMSAAMAQSAAPQAGGEDHMFAAVDDALRESSRPVPHGTPRLAPGGPAAARPSAPETPPPPAEPEHLEVETTAWQPQTPPPAPEPAQPEPPAPEPQKESAMSRYRRMINAVRGESHSDRAQAAGSPEPKAPAQPAASARPPVSSAPVPDAPAEQSPIFEALPDAPVDAELGRTIEFDDADAGVAKDPLPEFITDPMGHRKAGAKAPKAAPKAPAKPAPGATPQAPPKSAPQAPPKPVAPQPAPAPAAPPQAAAPAAAAPRPAPAEAPREATEVHVPVLITRSQVRKAVPIRLVLDIQVVDD